MLSDMGAWQPCDHSVKKDWELFFNWNITQWLETKWLNGFEKDSECTPVYTKLILNVLQMPGK